MEKTKGKIMIKDQSIVAYPYGVSYSHFRGDWLFAFQCRLYNFKFGVDWDFNKWQLDCLDIYIGFFNLSWTRIYAKEKKCKKTGKR